ncbi:hypothetical protein JCM19233_6845 [Vibrio astriarenae]|nr:hypothetical protein JCM19233_6845 [Vibrio sp. C7]
MNEDNDTFDNEDSPTSPARSVYQKVGFVGVAALVLMGGGWLFWQTQAQGESPPVVENTNIATHTADSAPRPPRAGRSFDFSNALWKSQRVKKKRVFLLMTNRQRLKSWKTRPRRPMPIKG